MKRLLCFLGIHNWSSWIDLERDANKILWQMRRCQNCEMADETIVFTQDDVRGFLKDFNKDGSYVHAIEKHAYDSLLADAMKLREALNAIKENTHELQPNSGHMYLANVNYAYNKARQALESFDAKKWKV